MELNSNAEKQARYRKKEQLRRRADQMLQKWQLEPWKHRFKSIQEIHHLIESAIKLPSGWTDENYSNAEKKLFHVYSEIVSPVNQLSNDVHESRDIANEFMSSSDPSKLTANLIHAEEKTKALASHIISALEISDCSESDQAAAIMEAMRFVGRNLTNTEVPCSQATAFCLATVNPIYVRPSWFAKKFADTLSKLIHPDLLHEIGKYLIK